MELEGLLHGAAAWACCWACLVRNAPQVHGHHWAKEQVRLLLGEVPGHQRGGPAARLTAGHA